MPSKEWIESNRDRIRGYKAKFYLANKAKVKAESVAFRNEMRRQVNEVKEISGCSLCAESDSCCLDFHHLSPDGKDFSIATALARGMSKARVFEEIHKCCVLCSNCHRKVHAGVLSLAGVV